MTERLLDQWAEWLLHRRHGNDPAQLRLTLDRLSAVRDRVLDNAGIKSGETLLDVGCGDGLIAFGALPRVGETGTVIFSDISRDILDHDRELANRLGLALRCRFVEASATDLSPVATASVDAVTTRSVLAYVADKRTALAEFARVLRPGGRIALYEPVNRLIVHEPRHQFFGFDVTPVQALAARVAAAYERRQPLDSDPMFDYDERDLLQFAADAGFEERHLELHVDVARQTPSPWRDFSETTMNPLAPTLNEAMRETLTNDEIDLFTRHLQPLVERGEGTTATAIAYLWGSKPA